MPGVEDTLAWYLQQPTLASLAPEIGAGAAAAGGLGGLFSSLAGGAVVPSFINFISNQIAQGDIDRANSQRANMALQDAGLAAGVPLEAWDVTNYEDVANTPAPEQRYDGTWTWNGQLYGTPLAAPVVPPSAPIGAPVPTPTSDSWLGQVADYFTGGNQSIVLGPGGVQYSTQYPGASGPTAPYIPTGTIGPVQAGVTTGNGILDTLALILGQAAFNQPNVATPGIGDLAKAAVNQVLGGDVTGAIAGGANLAPVAVVKTTDEEDAKTKVIIDWLGKYPNASDEFIRSTMDNNGITPADMAKATNTPLSTVTARYDAALPSTLSTNTDLTGKDTAAKIALDTAIATATQPVAPVVSTTALPTPSVFDNMTLPQPSVPIAFAPTTTPRLDAPVVTQPVVATRPPVNIDINKDGVVDAEQPRIAPTMPIAPTPAVVPVAPTPPPTPPNTGGLFASPTRTTDLLFGDPYQYERQKFTLLENLLSYGRY